MAKKENNISEIVNGFLKALSVDAKAKTTESEEEIKIEIDGKDASLLIGFHGDNLQAIRHLLAIMIRRKLGHPVSLSVDVAGYLAKKEERIKGMTQKAIETYDRTGEPQHLRELSSYERRIAHSYLTEKGYKSESVGEGYDRHIILSK